MSVSRVALPCARLSSSLLNPSGGASNALVVAPLRWYSVSKDEIHPGYKKIKEKYKHFQIDDGTPVHLKGGPLDRVMYYGTLISCGVGLVMCFEYFYSAAFPKKA